MIETTSRDVLRPELLQAMLAADSDLVVISDEVGRVQWVSPSVEHVLGWAPEQFRFVGPHLLHPGDQDDLATAFDLVRARPGAHHLGQLRHLGADGAWRTLEATAINLLDEHGALIMRYRDLGWRDVADPDPIPLDEVTGLPTRTSVNRSLTERLATAAQSVAVLFLDLDGFKSINDELGHGAGDVVLNEVAHRLGGRLRDSELLARWGGDEFVVVVDVPGPAAAVNVAARLHSSIVDSPFVVGAAKVSLGVSIGIAVGDRDLDASELVHRADQAMYKAKRSGGGIVTAAA